MFIVRIDQEDEEPDYKGFAARERAQAHVDEHFDRTFFDAEFKSVVLFEVTGTDHPREAIAAITERDKSRVRVLQIVEPLDVLLAKTDWEEFVAQRT